METLRLRARLLSAIRDFFAQRGVWEVDTPVLSAAAATDPHIDSFVTAYHGPDAPADGRLYLHTSPEFPMKRLLAAGAGSVYQICKVFRDGEAGRFHNPEFTLLEWYRTGFDHRALMDEVAALVNASLTVLGQTPLTPQRLSYRDAFRDHAGIDPLCGPVEDVIACAQAHGVPLPEGLPRQDRDAWLDLVLTQVVEPRLASQGMVLIYDYPASQAALARVRPGEPPLAERFELYLHGMELANGFHELADPVEQRRRFDGERQRRAAADQAAPPMDERLLAALSHGLPPCAGVALGVDRLLMVASGASHIREVIAFPVDRA